MEKLLGFCRNDDGNSPVVGMTSSSRRQESFSRRQHLQKLPLAVRSLVDAHDRPGFTLLSVLDLDETGRRRAGQVAGKVVEAEDCVKLQPVVLLQKSLRDFVRELVKTLLIHSGKKPRFRPETPVFTQKT